MAKPRNAITPTRDENYPEWYQQVVKAADLAENTPVRGCMVIKPWGYGIWENIRDALDTMFKETAIKMLIFLFLFPKVFYSVKPSILMVLLKSVQWLRIHAWKLIKMVFYSLQVNWMSL